MNKIIVDAKIKNKDSFEKITTEATKNKNNIIYYENDIKVIIKIYKSRIIIYRTSKNQKIILRFSLEKKEKARIELLDINKKIYSIIKTNKLLIENSKITIEYELDIYDNIFNYEIAWREK